MTVGTVVHGDPVSAWRRPDTAKGVFGNRAKGFIEDRVGSPTCPPYRMACIVAFWKGSESTVPRYSPLPKESPRKALTEDLSPPPAIPGGGESLQENL